MNTEQPTGPEGRTQKAETSTKVCLLRSAFRLLPYARSR